MSNQAVYIYNNLSPHLSLDLKKPIEVQLNPNIKCKSYKRNKAVLKKILF